MAMHRVLTTNAGKDQNCNQDSSERWCWRIGEIYEIGAHVEYYEALEATWVHAVVSRTDREVLPINGVPAADITVGSHNTPLRRVPLSKLRQPFIQGEKCSLFTPKEKRWVDAVIHERQPAATPRGYTIRLADETATGPAIVMQSVPPSRLRRHFEAGDIVQASLGPGRWVRVRVVAVPEELERGDPQTQRQVQHQASLDAVEEDPGNRHVAQPSYSSSEPPEAWALVTVQPLAGQTNNEAPVQESLPWYLLRPDPLMQPLDLADLD